MVVLSASAHVKYALRCNETVITLTGEYQ